MKLVVCILMVGLIYSEISFAEYKNIDQIMTDAAQEGTSLVKLLEDIQLHPAGSNENGNLMRVKKVAPGSVYEKMGIKAGDLVISKKMGQKSAFKGRPRAVKARRVNSPQKSMELYQKLKHSEDSAGYSSVSFRGQKINGNELHLYKQFNLKKGDTIVMFNGKPLSSPQDAMSLYTKLKKNQVTELLVQRDEGFELLSMKR